jgi:hypothetical protein
MLRPLDLLPQVLFFSLVKADELDAGPVPGSALLTPDENTALLSVDAVFEPDNAGLDTPFGLDPETGCAEIYYSGAVVGPLQLLKGDDPEGTVTLHGDGVSSQPFSLIVFCISHADGPAVSQVFLSLINTLPHTPLFFTGGSNIRPSCLSRVSKSPGRRTVP